MRPITSLRRHLRQSIIKQSFVGIAAMTVVLISVTYFLGRYKSLIDISETAKTSTKIFRSRIFEGDTKSVERQLKDILKLQDSEAAIILDSKMERIYRGDSSFEFKNDCTQIGSSCISSSGQQVEILEPIYFDEEGKSLFGYLFLSRKIQVDWIFLGIISFVFGLGYIAVFFGVTQITKSTMRLLVDGLESWSSRLSKNPKDIASFSETPYIEFQPLKRAIESLNQKIEEYENSAAEKAKLLLLRGIAHDILGPVAQAQMFLATLKIKSANYSELDDLVADAGESLEKVSSIATQVKMLKNLPVTDGRVELVEGISSEVETLKLSQEILDKKIQLHFDDGGYRSLELPISKTELSRILQNLVHNAAHASAPKSEIKIAILQHESKISISVVDQGHGIPVEIQSLVFQPDFTSKPGTGTGLGLSVVKHISETRGGSVQLQSSKLGTKVEVIFPSPFSEGVNHGL
jgi:signal transduction histidine kinase